jgi:hypothetical protein
MMRIVMPLARTKPPPEPTKRAVAGDRFEIAARGTREVGSRPTMRYDRRVIGYHACLKEVADRLLLQDEPFKPSANQWDWLGHGVYFWEFGHQRAYDWATEWPKLKDEDFAVVGAIIQLGECLDLLDTDHTKRLATFAEQYQRDMGPLPENRGPRRERDLSAHQPVLRSHGRSRRRFRHGQGAVSGGRARAGWVGDLLAESHPGRRAPTARNHRLVPSTGILGVEGRLACGAAPSRS